MNNILVPSSIFVKQKLFNSVKQKMYQKFVLLIQVLVRETDLSAFFEDTDSSEDDTDIETPSDTDEVNKETDYV